MSSAQINITIADEEGEVLEAFSVLDTPENRARLETAIPWKVNRDAVRMGHMVKAILEDRLDTNED